MASNEGPHWLVQRTLTAVSLGIALHYNEILKAWQTCGSNNVCKIEKLTLYLTKIFGISSPSILLSQLAKTFVNKLWTRVRGEPLIKDGDKNANWGPTIINLGIYAGVEYQLSFWWDWIRYATECLKLGVCENDDALVWIHNMKAEYCNRTEIEDVKVELDCLEGECLEIDDENLVTKIEDNLDLCVVFFNEMPLMASAAFIWIVYFFSLDAVNRTTEVVSDKQQREKEKRKGENKPKTAEDKSTKSAADKKKESTNKDRSSAKDTGKERGGDGDATTQEVLVACPICKKSRVACVPNPLLIFCANCGRNIGSKQKNISVKKSPISSKIHGQENTNNIAANKDYSSDSVSDSENDSISWDENCQIFKLDGLGNDVVCVVGRTNVSGDCSSFATVEQEECSIGGIDTDCVCESNTEQKQTNDDLIRILLE